MRPPARGLPAGSAGAVLIAMIAAAVLTAQGPGIHPVSGRHFAPVMGYQGADWLERVERNDEEAPDVALNALKIPRGATVADIGAGSGYITVKLASMVGTTGRVYANDVQPQMIQLLRQKLIDRRILNVTPVLGTVDDPKLPAGEIDLELLVDVYHELSQPQSMLRHLRDALKPGGRLVLVEYRKEDPTVPIRLEHKMSVAEARMEVEAEGFTLAKVDEVLPRQHLLIFTRRDP